MDGQGAGHLNRKHIPGRVHIHAPHVLSLSELPSRIAQCPQLEELLLDGNPLVSPPIELYNRSGWTAAKRFLEVRLPHNKTGEIWAACVISIFFELLL